MIRRLAIIGMLAPLAGGGTMAAHGRVARAAADPSGCGIVSWRRHGQPAHALRGAAGVVRAVRPLVPFTIGP